MRNSQARKLFYPESNLLGLYVEWDSIESIDSRRLHSIEWDNYKKKQFASLSRGKTQLILNSYIVGQFFDS